MRVSGIANGCLANPAAHIFKVAAGASPSPWGEGRDEGGQKSDLRRQAFAVGLVVPVPAAQGGVAGVGEKKWQRRRFNVAVAKDHVGFASRGVA